MEVCALCQANKLTRKAIVLCARCNTLLCEDCLDDHPGCLCLSCNVLTIYEKAARHQ
jgi:hypothetical protein